MQKVASEKIVVTGIGMKASNGKNREEVFSNCMNAVCGIKKCTLFDTSSLKTEYFGQADVGNENRMDALVFPVIREALSDARLTDFSSFQNKSSLAFATSPAQDDVIQGYLSGNVSSFWWLTSFLSRIKKEFHIHGASYTDMTACVAGTTCLGLAFDLLRSQKADIVLCCGADALTQTVCYGFHALQALSSGINKPFDRDRDGINIGEAGTCVIVERESTAKKRGVHIYGEIVGYGLGNDAYHMTAPDPSGYGEKQAIFRALCNISPEKIGYINAHGTGTTLNDITEQQVISEIFGDKPLVSSTKGVLGHCMSSTGLIESAITLMSLDRNIFPPTGGLTHKMDPCGENYLTEKKEQKITYALSDSFGFFGNTASILFKKWEEK